MNENKTPLFDAAEVTRALSLVVKTCDTFEIRILEPKRAGRSYMPRVIYGYFNDPALVPSALQKLGLSGAKGIYITMNPVAPELLARSCNKFTEAKDGHTTSDKDIVRRRWLLVDADPKRPSGISSNDEEKAHALECLNAIRTRLTEAGWPEPVVADSGNGYHLLYRMDEPAEGDLVKRCLVALDQQFSDDYTSVDTTVFNPSRIVKLYGTRAEKGDDCPDIGRPHRLSRTLSVPDSFEPVSTELLEALAGEVETKQAAPVAQASRSATTPGSSRAWTKERVQQFIDDHLSHCSPQAAQPYDSGWKWVLGVCPFNPEHTDRSAVVTIKADGVLGFRCQHDGCKGNNWKALRAKYDPPDQRGHQLAILPGDEKLFELHGAPVLTNSKGDPNNINQMFVAAKFAQDRLILYDPTLNQFFDYEAVTGLWRPKTEAKVVSELGVALRVLMNNYGGACLMGKRTENLLGQIMRLLRGEVEHAQAFRHERPIIHVGNGVLHLDEESLSLNEFDPAYFSRNRSEICFDEEAECPRFIAELLRPALDDEDISLIQRYAGQCLLGHNPSQRILLLRGTPGGGKSTLVNVLEMVIGPYNVTQLRVQHLAERFELAGFVGKSLLCGKDVPGDFLNNKSAYVLKALVGGDRLDAEQKNVKHRFDLMGEFNVLITSNTRLHVKLDSDSGAWRRRLLIVDYERPPAAKPIPNFDRHLVADEGPGILNWCIAGALQLLRELEQHGAILMTEAQQKRVDALLSESDSVRKFAGECIEVFQGYNVTVNELATAYHNFCGEQGWQAISVRQFENSIANVMMELFRTPKRTDVKRDEKPLRGFYHVRLKGGDLV